MDNILTTEDPLDRELYDVRREAEVMGNLVEEDMAPALAALRARAPVHKGSLRSLLGLPPTTAMPWQKDVRRGAWWDSTPAKPCCAIRCRP